jgi:hypothetical protein
VEIEEAQSGHSPKPDAPLNVWNGDGDLLHELVLALEEHWNGIRR